MTEGIVSIHGKDYKTVAYRVKEFQKGAPGLYDTDRPCRSKRCAGYCKGQHI